MIGNIDIFAKELCKLPNEILLGVVGEADALVLHLLGGFQQIHRVVADPLKIADGVQQGVHALAVGVAELVGGQLDQVGAQSVLVVVHLLLLLPGGAVIIKSMPNSCSSRS